MNDTKETVTYSGQCRSDENCVSMHNTRLRAGQRWVYDPTAETQLAFDGRGETKCEFTLSVEGWADSRPDQLATPARISGERRANGNLKVKWEEAREH